MSATTHSPDVLRARPRGITRINKRLSALIILVLAVVMLLVFFGGIERMRNSRLQQEEEDNAIRLADLVGREATSGYTDGLLAPRMEPLVRMPTNEVEPTAPAPSVEQELEPEPDPLIERLRQRRLDALESALTSGTKVQTDELTQNENAQTAAPAAGGVMGRGPATPEEMLAQGATAGGSTGFSGADIGSASFFGALSGDGARQDTGLQNRKRDFLKSGGDFGELGYLDSQVVPPLSPYELKSGTVIPAAMLTGINSDLPGFITAQVAEDVYDSATGRYLLVPKGSRIVGVYDSEIAYAQNRLLVAWNKIVFPNGAAMQINGMPGVDGIGQAGVKDKVNNHYWRIFGAAVLASLFSVGYELTQDRNNAQDDDVSDTVSEVVGQQIALLGVQMARRGMNIQPTIEIRPGSIIQVMVTKDMVFPGQYTAN